jgi:serine/threonine protein kinase
VLFCSTGAYGTVAEARDHSCSPPRRVAIKQVKGVFRMFETAKRIYREIRLLRCLNHANIVKIVHVQMPRWESSS